MNVIAVEQQPYVDFDILNVLNNSVAPIFLAFHD
jgi:hypothetical protein